MPWFKLDDAFDSHPKVIAAGNEAVGLFVRCGTYCARHLTDGFIPEHVALLYGSAELAETLVRAKLWRRVRGGWRMPDYLEYNPSAQTVDKDRAAKNARQQRWREARGRRNVDASTGASRDASKDGAPTPSPPRPEGSGAGNAPKNSGGGRQSPTGQPPPEKPPWCGHCDERSRQTGDPPARCPNCHPLTSQNGHKPVGRHAKELS